MPWPPPSEVLGESDGAKDGLAEPDAELADSAIAQVLEADDLFRVREDEERLRDIELQTTTAIRAVG